MTAPTLTPEELDRFLRELSDLDTNYVMEEQTMDHPAPVVQLARLQTEAEGQLEELAEKWLERARAIGHCHGPSASSRGRAAGLREAARELKNTLSLILEQEHED